VEVTVAPRECALDRDVQIPEGVVARNLDAPPNQRFDAQQLDSELQNRGFDGHFA
jgi:hypothetical protein